MPKAITLEEFEDRKKKLFPQFTTIKFLNMTSPYIFFCPIHKEQTISSARDFLKSKFGCSECFREDKAKNVISYIPTRVKYNNSQLEEKLLKIHGDKYIFYFPEYDVGNKGRINVYCKKHDLIWSATISNLLSGEGCRLCAKKAHNEAITKFKEDFLNDCKNKFGEMYDYDLSDYKNGDSHINIICKKCGYERNVIAKSFLGGAGICPVCDESEGEFLVRRFLIENKINFFQHYTEFNDCKYKNNLEFDFYLPELNITIEFQGEQHYIDNGWKSGEEFKNQQIRDQIKRDYCKVNNIKEIEIPYWEKDNIESLLTKLIKE